MKEAIDLRRVRRQGLHLIFIAILSLPALQNLYSQFNTLQCSVIARGR